MAAIDPDRLQAALGRIAAQDRHGLRELYELTEGPLLALAARVLRDAAAAEDVVQEVFVNVWRRAADLPLRVSVIYQLERFSGGSSQ